MQITTEKNTRSRLLEAAAELIWERSYQATSVDELCERARAKKGSFYHFFSSKTDLTIAAIENFWEQVKQEVFEPVFNSSESGLQQLQLLVETLHQFQTQVTPENDEYLGCPFGSLGQEMACQEDRLRLTMQKIFEQHYDYFEKALDKATAAGEIDKGDNRARARTIFALLEGTMMLAKVSRDPELLRSLGPSLLLLARSQC